MGTITEIMTPLLAKADAIVEAAETRAINAEADRAEAKRLIAAAMAIFANDDEDGVTAVETVEVAAPVEVAEFAHDMDVPVVEASVEIVTDDRDAPFFAALDHQFKSAGIIRKALTANGVQVSEGTVYNRMRKILAARPDAVEGTVKPERWRLKAKAPAPVDEKGDTALPTLSPMLTGKPRKAPAVPKATVAANDATIVPPTDVNAPLLVKGDGLAMIRGMADKSVDLFLTDLPYGTTGLKIDPTIDVDEWMAEMHRVVTDRGSIVAFSLNPFTNRLITASQAFDQGIQRFHRDDLIWEKPKATGYPQSHNRHMKAHENILIFSRGTVVTGSKRRMTYNPQGATKTIKKARDTPPINNFLANSVCGHVPGQEYGSLENCPRSILRFSKDHDSAALHPFAKPVALLEYLIRTFSNPGELVLDPTMGSGSAGVAALNTGRRFIGAENGTDKKGRCIYSIAKARIDASLADKAA